MPNPKKGKVTEPTHHDQKINTSGRGRSLAVGKVLPKDWDWVRVTATEGTDKVVTFTVRKLELREA